jgi:hypothetical protein
MPAVVTGVSGEQSGPGMRNRDATNNMADVTMQRALRSEEEDSDFLATLGGQLRKLQSDTDMFDFICEQTFAGYTSGCKLI